MRRKMVQLNAGLFGTMDSQYNNCKKQGKDHAMSVNCCSYSRYIFLVIPGAEKREKRRERDGKRQRGTGG
jgi:hypothetical protein